MDKTRLRIAIQKKGRLYTDSMDLLTRCGLKVRIGKNSLFYHCENFPIDLLLVRDDDILTLVTDQICDLGIVGENVLFEQQLQTQAQTDSDQFEIVKKLGFSPCRLMIAVPENRSFDGIASLNGDRIATSYPYLLQQFLDKHQLNAKTLHLSGSVEIAPRLEMADSICDLVSTGRTLEENNLKIVAEVMHSQAVLIKPPGVFAEDKHALFELLLNRIHGAIKAQESKYIMFHAPKEAVEAIRKLLPGSEIPTVMPLGDADKVAVHVVSPEGVFWDTLEKLKKAGASSILVLTIEKMLN